MHEVETQEQLVQHFGLDRAKNTENNGQGGGRAQDPYFWGSICSHPPGNQPESGECNRWDDLLQTKKPLIVLFFIFRNPNFCVK